MFHHVQSVLPMPEYCLLVKFSSGEAKLYDTKPLAHRWQAFAALSTINGLFGCVRVDAGGYGVSWNDELDLSCDELYEKGHLLSHEQITDYPLHP